MNINCLTKEKGQQSRLVNWIIRMRIFLYPYMKLSDSDTNNIHFISYMDYIHFVSDTNIFIRF